MTSSWPLCLLSFGLLAQSFLLLLLLLLQFPITYQTCRTSSCRHSSSCPPDGEMLPRAPAAPTSLSSLQATLHPSDTLPSWKQRPSQCLLKASGRLPQILQPETQGRPRGGLHLLSHVHHCPSWTLWGPTSKVLQEPSLCSGKLTSFSPSQPATSQSLLL